MKFRRDLIVVALATFCLTASLFMIGSIRSAGIGEYNPWADINNDGTVDIFDAILLAGAFNTKSQNITKGSVAYDSGWVNISDKAGQDIALSHGLGMLDQNNESMIIEITGKTVPNGDLLRHLGVQQLQAWSMTYGGTNYDVASALVQTIDGGYALAGVTTSFGAGSYDAWLVKTDQFGNAQWNKTYGGAGDDGANGLVQTIDGGYALAGSTTSFGAGSYDFWLVKTDASGNMQWNKTYGGTDPDSAHALVQTGDGGYVLAGGTNSFGAGNNDFWLVKTDASGNMQWNKTYGGTNTDSATALVQTGDGGFALAGWARSFGAGADDFWLVKTDASGNMQWNKTYGGTNYDDAFALVQTVDGGFALAGSTRSFGAGTDDFWLVKTDASGNMQWNKTYGGEDYDDPHALVQTVDGGFALAGSTNSFAAGISDFWLVRTDASGNMLWNKAYPGTNDGVAYALVKIGDGGFALAGEIDSTTENSNFYLVKVGSADQGLSWVSSSTDTITIYRATGDLYWNYVRVRILKVK